MIQTLLDQYPFYLSTVLLAMGIWGMFVKRNLMKKLIGMTIFQVAIILLFISSAVKFGGTIPTFDPSIGATDPTLYVNPLPHVLMLTAIVVMVATSGVALAILLIIYRRYHTLDEQEIIKRMRE
ncbi:MAG: NADH-quinone oxidoreductase subunit J [Chloroflexi bacterium RBG_16_48_7]|nr:MAG: NADH-quinone oxidoreductase subunit J [Chloroflexi bacterium RBG_16_48_7]